MRELPAEAGLSPGGRKRAKKRRTAGVPAGGFAQQTLFDGRPADQQTGRPAVGRAWAARALAEFTESKRTETAVF